MAPEAQTAQTTIGTPEPHNRHRLIAELSRKTKSALQDVDNLLTAGLCILRAEEFCGEPGNAERMDALATLLEYGRGAVCDGKESLEDMAACLCGEHPEAPEMSYTVPPEAEA
jgi:hypothetical protein